MATDEGDREGLVQPADRRQSERFFHVRFQATPARSASLSKLQAPLQRESQHRGLGVLSLELPAWLVGRSSRTCLGPAGRPPPTPALSCTSCRGCGGVFYLAAECQPAGLAQFRPI